MAVRVRCYYPTNRRSCCERRGPKKREHWKRFLREGGRGGEAWRVGPGVYAGCCAGLPRRPQAANLSRQEAGRYAFTSMIAGCERSAVTFHEQHLANNIKMQTHIVQY